MKKTLLLSSLVVAATAFAATSGSVESYVKTTNSLTEITAKDAKVKEFVAGTEVELGVKTEVSVNDSGLSFGAKVDSVKGKLFNFSNVNQGNLVSQFKDESNVWAKYTFPAVSGVETYAKATLNLDKRLTLEGNAKTTVSDVELGLNSKLAATLSSEANPALLLNGYAKGNVSVLKDVKLELETKNSFGTDAYGFDYVSGVLSGKYDALKDLELNGKVSLKYQFANKSKFANVYLDDDGELGPKNLVDTYELSAKYTGLDKTTVSGAATVQHVNYSPSEQVKLNTVSLGLKGEVEYKGVENLTLTGSANGRLLTIPTIKAVEGAKLGLTAKGVYEYKVTDKVTVTPELKGEYNLSYTHATKTSKHDVTLTPAVKTEYKVSDSLTLTGKASLPVEFSTKSDKALDYASTNLKTELNVKYTW